MKTQNGRFLWPLVASLTIHVVSQALQSCPPSCSVGSTVDRVFQPTVCTSVVTGPIRALSGQGHLLGPLLVRLQLTREKHTQPPAVLTRTIYGFSAALLFSDDAMLSKYFCGLENFNFISSRHFFSPLCTIWHTLCLKSTGSRARNGSPHECVCILLKVLYLTSECFCCVR